MVASNLKSERKMAAGVSFFKEKIPLIAELIDSRRSLKEKCRTFRIEINVAFRKMDEATEMS
jgi:hypothetical protein